MFSEDIEPAIEPIIDMDGESTMALYILMLTADIEEANILAKLEASANAAEATAERVRDFLLENLELFRINAEEDGEYRAEDAVSGPSSVPSSSRISEHDPQFDGLSRIEQDRIIKERQRREIEEARSLDDQKIIKQFADEEQRRLEEVKEK